MLLKITMRLLFCSILGFVLCANVHAAAWELTSRQGEKLLLRIEHGYQHSSIRIVDRESNRTILATERAHLSGIQWSWHAGRHDTNNGCTVSVHYNLRQISSKAFTLTKNVQAETIGVRKSCSGWNSYAYEYDAKSLD